MNSHIWVIHLRATSAAHEQVMAYMPNVPWNYLNYNHIDQSPLELHKCTYI